MEFCKAQIKINSSGNKVFGEILNFKNCDQCKSQRVHIIRSCCDVKGITHNVCTAAIFYLS
jgi:hypothetical protein